MGEPQGVKAVKGAALAANPSAIGTCGYLGVEAQKHGDACLLGSAAADRRRRWKAAPCPEEKDAETKKRRLYFCRQLRKCLAISMSPGTRCSKSPGTCYTK